MKEEWLVFENRCWKKVRSYDIFNKFKGDKMSKHTSGTKIRYIKDKLHGKLTIFYFWEGKVLR